MWVDTHCHLDAAEFDCDRARVAQRAYTAGVQMLVMPAVQCQHFAPLRALAHAHGWAYALGLHPLYLDQATDGDLITLRAALQQGLDDPHLVAVGEIGLDYFVPGLDAVRQQRFYDQQLRLAAEFNLPVILHVRRSADALLKQLRRYRVPGGIAHAFNGSQQQALAFVDLGFKLGFGGAMTFERALQIRQLARDLPLSAIVLETDAPDIPPHWLYKTAEQRAQGQRSRNEPGELPRIARTLCELRGLSEAELAAATTDNAQAGLPRLAALMASKRSVHEVMPSPPDASPSVSPGPT